MNLNKEIYEYVKERGKVSRNEVCGYIRRRLEEMGFRDICEDLLIRKIEILVSEGYLGKEYVENNKVIYFLGNKKYCERKVRMKLKDILNKGGFLKAEFLGQQIVFGGE